MYLQEIRKIYQIDTFSFQISKTLIDFGELIENTHTTDTNTLTITTKGAGGYTVYAFEEHPLKQVPGSQEIPDTTCDSGTCSHTSAAVWSNQSVAGFGYISNCVFSIVSASEAVFIYVTFC